MKRKKIKTILCHMAIITICAGVFCHGYINGLSISKYDRLYSYAEADNWSSCDTSDLVTAFRYYCKSRNLAIEGSVADALTTFTTSTFNNLCSTIGIDPTQLQAELKKTTDGNLGLRFLFSNTGITAYNRLFAEFLQNNELAVGDNVDDLNVYSGEYYADGHCMIYVIDKVYVSASGNPYSNSAIKMGSPFIYDKDDFISNRGINNTLTVSAFGQTRNFIINGASYYQKSRYYNFSGTNSTYYETIDGDLEVYEANVALIHQLSDNKYFIGYYCHGNFNNGSYAEKYSLFGNGSSFDIPADSTDDAEVNLTTNNSTINNNTYNNNYVIIYNEGDTYVTDDDEEPLPTTPPGGGGGGGGDDPGGEPDSWNPTQPTIPSPSSPSFPTVNLPEIDIPDLPSLNFSLGDLRNKFPFSLPFDIIAVLNVLDGEPQAPHIEATVPIGRWYTWEMDFDFSEFDNYARIFRAFEFIGFCIGLAIFTVHFVKG